MAQSAGSNRSKVSIFLWFMAMSCGPAATVHKTKTAKIAAPKAAALKADYPSKCPAPKIKGQPEFCQSGEELYVVGLAPGQGVDRGERMLLEVAFVDGGYKETVGMVAVLEPRDNFAKVALLYQRPRTRLAGAAARKIKTDERVRLGKYIARIEDKKGGQLRLDVGQGDGAVEGDVYEVLSRQDYRPIGRLRITELEEMFAWATSLNQDEPFIIGQDVTFLKSRGEQLQAQPVLIAVVNFDPRDEMDKREASAGRSFAKDLADAMAKAAEGADSISVKYFPDERIKLGQGAKEAHASARDVGRQNGAQIVVWGSMRCEEKGCALPRFTVVDPEQFHQNSYQGERILLEEDEAGFEFKETPPEEPLALAAAMLGDIASDAQRYGDATYYLTRAIEKKVLQGDDELKALDNLAYASYVRGQITKARQVALRLVKLAEDQKRPLMQMSGHGELARIDALEGETASSQEHLEFIIGWADSHDEQESLAFALNELGLLKQTQGDVSEARRLLQQSLEISEQIGNLNFQAGTLGNLGLLEKTQGRVSQARELYQRSLEIKKHTGDINGQASALQKIGVLENLQGHVSKARLLFQQSLELRKRTGDLAGQATTLNSIGVLEESQGRVSEARALYQQSLEIQRRIGDLDGQATTLNNLGLLDVSQGRVKEARNLYRQSMEIKKRIGNLAGQARTLSNLGALEESQGLATEARSFYERSLEIKRRIGDLGGEAKTLNNLGLLERSQGRMKKARELFERSLEIKKRIGDFAGSIVTAVNLAALEIGEGNTAAGRKILVEQLTLAKSIRHVPNQAYILDLLGQTNKILGDLKSARECWLEAKALFTSLKMTERADRLTDWLSQLDVHAIVGQTQKPLPDLLVDGGVVITEVFADGQAARAGIAPGDILLRYGKKKLNTPESLQTLIKSHDPKKEVAIEAVREGKKILFKVHSGILGVTVEAVPPPKQ